MILFNKAVFRKFNFHIVSNFYSIKIQDKIVSPKEIREIVRSLQVQKQFFHESKDFNKWKNSDFAIQMLRDFYENKDFLYKRSTIFEDYKKFIQAVILDQEKHLNESIFSLELITEIDRKIFQNFEVPSFLEDNINFSTSSFWFLYTLLEYEKLVKNDKFLEKYFEILTKTIKLFCEHKNFNKLILVIDELFKISIKILEGKFIESYNPHYYNEKFKYHAETLISGFENYYLFLYNSAFSVEKLNLFEKTCFLFSTFDFANLKVIDYTNYFLIKNMKEISMMRLIDILKYLSKFQSVINYQLLNSLFWFISKNESQLINYPNDYLVDIVHIFSKNFIQGASYISEKVCSILKTKESFSLNFRDNASFLISVLKSKYFNEQIFLFFFRSMRQNFSLNYVRVKAIKGLIDRFVTIDYNDEDFFRFIYEKMKEKENELKGFEKNFDEETFREFIKEECLKEKIIYEVITKKDFYEYLSLLNDIIMICLFKLKYDYNIKSVTEFEFKNGEVRRFISNKI